jgi:hypothetical protein
VLLALLYAIRFYFFYVVVNRSRQLLVEEENYPNPTATYGKDVPA